MSNDPIQIAIDALESLMAAYSSDIERAIEIMAELGRNCDPASSMIAQTKRMTEYDKVLAALRQHQQDGGWRCISTAYTDGTEMLGVDEEGALSVFRWGKHNHVPIYGWVRQIELYGEEKDGFSPILWQPINPPDPKKESDDERNTRS